MENRYEFFIAGRARNKENILKICNMLDKYNISYYCFLKNEDSWGYGNENQTPEEKQKEFESLGLKNEIVINLFNQDLGIYSSDYENEETIKIGQIVLRRDLLKIMIKDYYEYELKQYKLNKGDKDGNK